MIFGSTLFYGCSSVGRASVSKTECREFESLHPCFNELEFEMNIKGYFAEVYNELVNKVSWPSWSELQSSATIVMIASVLIAIGIFVMDFVFRHVMTFVYIMFY